MKDFLLTINRKSFKILKASFAGSPNQNPWNPYQKVFLKEDDIKSKMDVNKSKNHFSRVFYKQRTRKKCFEKKQIFFRPENLFSNFHFGENRWFLDRGSKLKKWKFKSKTARRVLQTCPLVLKLCEVAVLISFTTSESFAQKYSFLVKLSRIFDVALKQCFCLQ